MEISDNLIHSRSVPAGQSGELIQFSRQAVHWEWMSFSVRRLAPGESWEWHHPGEETACVLLSGTCAVEWNKQRKEIGKLPWGQLTEVHQRQFDIGHCIPEQGKGERRKGKAERGEARRNYVPCAVSLSPFP